MRELYHADTVWVLKSSYDRDVQALKAENENLKLQLSRAQEIEVLEAKITGLMDATRPLLEEWSKLKGRENGARSS